MRTVARQSQPAFLYVASWEVCNHLGGVYTVLETSAPHFRSSYYGDDLLYIGPDLWADKAAQASFAEDPMQPEVAALAAERDIPVRFGRWAIPGSPPCALVDFGRLLERKNSLLGDLWNEFAVDSINADWDTVERLLFGYAVGKLIELHYHALVRPRARRAIAHFHQWAAAAGLLRLSRTTPEIATVYTPHGTALGRALASSGVTLHTDLKTVDPAASAKERKLEAPHTLEVAAAKRASVLTCVSEHEGDEAAHLLGRRPDVVTHNGYTPPSPPARPREEMRVALLECAGKLFGAAVDPSTRLALTSGRYEFRNKGLDLLIRAIGALKAGESPARPLLLYIFVAANHTGPRHEMLRRMKEEGFGGESLGICTHNLAHPDEDEILRACRAAGIENRPDDKVRVIFAPVRLDGRDGLFPQSYADILQSCDLTLFPSLYEPWGYTPLESLAAGVPTVTTDLTGFGRFVAHLPESERTAVTVLPGAQGDNGALVETLRSELWHFLGRSDDELIALRRCGGAVVERTSWDRLISQTIEAHHLALEKASQRGVAGTRPWVSRLSRRSVIVIQAKSEVRPQLYRFSVSAAVPERIGRLADLARNVWWSWNPRARALFEMLSEGDFDRVEGNPVRLLRTLDPQTLGSRSRNREFLALYDEVIREFDAYLGRERAPAPSTAYFCAEFALHESLPIYSGGLGVLAGDHLKSSSDLQLPLVGVGLRYADGYFRQRIQPDGRQGVEFVPFDARETPLTEVVAADGTPVRISLPMPERELRAGAWRVEVGSVPLYLLDTLIAENDPADREVTRRLYPSDREPRLRQEILLGMGGWRLLKALGKSPRICHLNEGHSAFLLVERLLDLIEEEGLTYAEAAEVVRAGTVFTTHTPVPAGHDRFAEGMMRRYFGPVVQRLGLSWEEFYALGTGPSDTAQFSMTNLALRLAGRANGVSRLHGDVSRTMNAEVWPGFHEAEAPIDAITNGVHLGTWVGPEMGDLLDRHLERNWRSSNPERIEWERAEEIPDAEVWAARQGQRRRFSAWLRASVEETAIRRGERPASLKRRLEGIREEALWIGFARRFAPYKRAALLFRDPERLAALLDSTSHPVRIVYAGKSHPDDGEGAELVRQIVALTTDPRFAGRVFFVEDYGLASARMLLQGVDVWLNTPARPLEASGTSGMKASANGVLHFSVLDGWWCEGYDGSNGWVIGKGRAYENAEMQSEHDARTLYGTLEADLLPLFFDRAAGVPTGWTAKIKRCLATIPAFFNTHRMVGDYVRTSYAPLGRALARLEAEDYAGARTHAERLRLLRDAWKDVKIANVSVTDLSRGSIGIGEVFEVRAQVALGTLKPEDLAVELYVGPAGPTGELTDPVVIPLIRDGEAKDGVAEYTGAYLPRGAGAFRYGVRVMPAMSSFQEIAALGLVRWA